MSTDAKRDLDALFIAALAFELGGLRAFHERVRAGKPYPFQEAESAWGRVESHLARHSRLAGRTT